MYVRNVTQVALLEPLEQPLNFPRARRPTGLTLASLASPACRACHWQPCSVGAFDAPTPTTAACPHPGAAQPPRLHPRAPGPSRLAAQARSRAGGRARRLRSPAQAQASAGSGPGWTAAVLTTDESGQVHSANGNTLTFIPGANAPPVLIGYDEGGPLYQPAGQWFEFNEETFAAHYRGQAGAALQTLAASYDTDPATLLARHPELWAIATTDHALNACPGPEGRAASSWSPRHLLNGATERPSLLTSKLRCSRTSPRLWSSKG